MVYKYEQINQKMFAALCAVACTASMLPSTVFASGSFTQTYEAEDATIVNFKTGSDEGFSGGEYVRVTGSGSVTFTVDVPEEGFYDLNFRARGDGSDKLNYASVNGERVGEFESLGGEISDGYVYRVRLNAGTNEIAVTSNWGYISLDCLIVTSMEGSAEEHYEVANSLINPNASQTTKNLMGFIVDNYGKNVISGQVTDGGIDGAEFGAIKNISGKTPAMLGVDFMRYTPSRVNRGDSDNSVEDAIEFWEAGGIVEFCWHWNAPDKYLKPGTDSDGNPTWYGGFYTANVNMDFSAIMDGQDQDGYNTLMSDIDAIAEQIQRLEDAGVSILFRPLHEASGGWFWWGSDGPEPYKELWITIYDKLTNEHGLDNIIWVWNGQDADWYPGDEYVDIIGEDIYPGNHVYSPQSSKFLEAANYSDTNKVVAMTENGCLFDIDAAIESKTLWSWFCTWSGTYSAVSEAYTEREMWEEVYTHPNVLTLEDMPDFETYEPGTPAVDPGTDDSIADSDDSGTNTPSDSSTPDTSSSGSNQDADTSTGGDANDGNQDADTSTGGNGNEDDDSVPVINTSNGGSDTSSSTVSGVNTDADKSPATGTASALAMGAALVLFAGAGLAVVKSRRK